MFFKEVSKIPMIDSNKEVELAKRIKNGDNSAINELIKANLRFVISVAKQYQNKGLPLVDLIQEGCLGIAEAAKRYDETKGFKFISYAVWWIRQAITRAISEQCRTVRIPMNQILCLGKVNKATEKLEQELSRTPSTEELSEEIDISSEKINIAISSNTRSLSLDTPFKDEETGCLLDILPNGNSSNTDESLVSSNTTSELVSILDKLPDRERDIIMMSFGIKMEQLTLEEIATRFGIGSERVRQIQNEALKKLKKLYGSELRELL